MSVNKIKNRIKLKAWFVQNIRLLKYNNHCCALNCFKSRHDSISGKISSKNSIWIISFYKIHFAVRAATKIFSMTSCRVFSWLICHIVTLLIDLHKINITVFSTANYTSYYICIKNSFTTKSRMYRDFLKLS